MWENEVKRRHSANWEGFYLSESVIIAYLKYNGDIGNEIIWFHYTACVMTSKDKGE